MKRDMTNPADYKAMAALTSRQLLDTFDKLICHNCGHEINAEADDKPSPPPDDPAGELTLYRTAVMVPGVHEGQGLLPNVFDETLFLKPDDMAGLRPPPIEMGAVGVLPCAPGEYDFDVENNGSVVIGNVLRNHKQVIEIKADDEAKVFSWAFDGSSKISLIKRSFMYDNNYGNFGLQYEPLSLLSDVLFSCINNSPRDQSYDVEFNQESSDDFGAAYCLLFELAQENHCDLLLHMPHLMCQPPPNSFFFAAVAGQAADFLQQNDGLRVFSAYSTDLSGSNGQMAYVSSLAPTYFPDDTPQVAYERMVGRLAGTSAGHLNLTCPLIVRVAPWGYGPGMLQEYIEASDGLEPEFWSGREFWPGGESRLYTLQAAETV